MIVGNRNVFIHLVFIGFEIREPNWIEQHKRSIYVTKENLCALQGYIDAGLGNVSQPKYFNFWQLPCLINTVITRMVDLYVQNVQIRAISMKDHERFSSPWAVEVSL